MDTEEKFKQFPVVGILRGLTLEQSLPFIPALLESNWPYLEITMDTAGATEQIRALAEQYGNDISIGAGTVCNTAQLDAALEAGATFIVTPIVDEDVIRQCAANNIPVFPGAFSPTEVYKAWDLGATMVKLFPANQLGPNYVKNLKGPLSQIRLLATGGVSADNIQDYLDAGAEGFGIGSCVFNKQRIEKHDWDWVNQQIFSLKAVFNERYNK